MSYKLDTFLTATDGIGYSKKRKFYQTGYGWGFNYYFWIELETEPVTPTVPSVGGGPLISFPLDKTKVQKHIDQIHVVRIFMKTPTGEIVSKRWTINKTFYNIILKYIGQTIVPPKFILKQINFISNIYSKIKVKLIKIT